MSRSMIAAVSLKMHLEFKLLTCLCFWNALSVCLRFSVSS
jgi:hypothetical protein